MGIFFVTKQIQPLSVHGQSVPIKNQSRKNTVIATFSNVCEIENSNVYMVKKWPYG